MEEEATCCYIYESDNRECKNKAEWEMGETGNDYTSTLACSQHLVEMLSHLTVNYVTRYTPSSPEKEDGT
jgi:hypothetical protein